MTASGQSVVADGPRSAPREVPLRALLAPRMMATRRAFRRSPTRIGIATALTGLLWLACFALFSRVLEYFYTIADFGPLLTERLLVLLLVTFASVLLISNTVSALTTFYLADDVSLLFAAPVTTRRLHHARFVETAISSSWMVLLFGLPAFLAYGVVHDAGPVFYLGVIATMLPFLVIPAALGVLITTALVLIFPARRTRDGLLVLVGVLVGLAFVLARTLQPEKLAEPSGMVGFAAFLVGFGGLPSPYLPTTWAAEALVPLLGAREGDPGFFLAMLYSTAAMTFVVSAAVVEHAFPRAWTLAQEGRVFAGGERPLAARLRRLTSPLPRTQALLFAKDLTVFFRDATQWSQLLLLLALVVIYVFNFSVLPVDDETALGLMMRDIAALLNLGLAAFVTTAVAVRFVYPAPSLEGRSWWILRSAPVAIEKIWWSKFWLGYLPLLFLGELLIIATNHFLGVGHTLTLVFGVTLVPLLAAVVSLGLAFGAAYPRLDTQNAAQIATGFGAIIYMVTCLGLIAVVSGLEAWPVTRLFWTAHASTPLAAWEWALVLLAFIAAAAVTISTFAFSRRYGLRAFSQIPV